LIKAAFVKQTVLTSYRNGQAAGQRPAQQSAGSNAQAGRPQWANKKRIAGLKQNVEKEDFG
jgi:hypothetical protein